MEEKKHEILRRYRYILEEKRDTRSLFLARKKKE
jgi:hypothetical protein